MSIEVMIAAAICMHDPRSEYYADLKVCDDEWTDAPPEGCRSCDNCFYGRHKLASTLAALQQQGEAVKQVAVTVDEQEKGE